MEWLNYHHLFYFWIVAREGSIARATRQLGLAEPTISGQIHRLEEVLGEKLFERSGRRLVLTECGRLAYGYAEAIFSLGREFTEVLKGRAGARPGRLRVGVADVLPKPIVSLLLQPALRSEMRFHLVCREDKSVEEFLDQLVAHALDLVLADGPAVPGRVRLINHYLGDSGTSVFGTRGLVRALRGRFPQSLRGAPFLVTGPESTRRRRLEQWFEERRVRPHIVAQVDDASLLMELGRSGAGLFIGPSLMETEICRRYTVDVVGRAPDVRQQFYAISAERRIDHPAVRAICQSARDHLRGDGVARKPRMMRGSASLLQDGSAR